MKTTTTAKRERVKQEEFEISQDMLAAMESDIAASEVLIKKRQDARPAGEGQTTIKGIMKSYRVKVKGEKGSVQFVHSATPPDRSMVKGKKDPKKSFPESITIYTQVVDMDRVPDTFEPLEEGGGWRVKVKLTFSDDAKTWIEKHFWEYYDGTFKTRVPIDTYIDAEGTMATHKWVQIQERSVVQIKVNDSDGNLFRKKTPSGAFEVSPLTRISFGGCVPEMYVSMREEFDPHANSVAVTEDAAAEGVPAAAVAKEKVPQGYTTFTCKGSPILADDHDPDMPPTERQHASVNKDTHLMIPIEDLRAGKPCPMTVDFYACAQYTSKPGTPNGVTIFKMKVDELRDFYRVFDGKETATYSIRLNVFQWHGAPATKDKYSVKIVSGKDTPDLWRALGILDPKTFGFIAHANKDIPCWAEVTLWKKAVLNADDNKADKIHENDALRNIRGHYTYGFKTLMFDLLRYFPTRGIQISKKRVVEEFDAWIGTNNKSKETTMNLQVTRDTTIKNPLHYAELMSPVMSLGNNAVEDPDAKIPKPLNHGFTGNVWPIMDDCDFYVLTSHVLTIEERDQYCGDGATLPVEEHDKFLNRLIKDDHVLYWIYALRRDVVERYCNKTYAAPAPLPSVQQVVVPSPKKAKKTKPSAAAAAEEDEAPVAMELEEEEETRPTPKKKPAAKQQQAKKK